MEFQGKQRDYTLRIKNEADPNSCVWNFSINNRSYKEEYTGRDMKELKEMFNKMIRSLMKMLSENPDDREVER